MRYAIPRKDGGVEILQTVGAVTPDECLAKWSPEHQAELVGTWEEIEDAAVPTDRTYRNAWKLDAGRAGIVHDMPKARDLHRDILRAERAPKLAVLDVQYMRAIEDGDVGLQADIVAKKQALRDVTDDPAIELATTVDELKTVVLPEVSR